MKETEIMRTSPVEGCSDCSFDVESGKWEDRGSSDDSGNNTEEGSDTSGESDTTEGSEDDDSDEEESSTPYYSLPEQVGKQLCLLDIDLGGREPFLCSQCRDTDLIAALDHTSKAAQGAANPLVVADRVGLDPDCALCRLFRGTILSSSSEVSGGGNGDGEGSEAMASLRHTTSPPPTWKLSAFNKRSMLMDIRISWMFQPVEVAILYAGEDAHVQHINKERVEREGFLACARTRDLRALLEKNQSTETEPLSRFVLPQYDPALVREWLDFCDFDSGGQFSIPGMKVIDCHSYTIVDHLPGMAYLALSYVWSLAGADMVAVDTEPVDRANARSLPPMIPRVVSNAIQVVAEVDYRYLWVDQFCIDQSAAQEHIAEHISKMDLIYSNATLAIIAASSGGALPGVGGTPRTERTMLHLKGRVDEKMGTVEDDLTIFTTPAPVAALQQTVWYSRGWCFQESVLAPRKLYFMDHEMVFQAEGINCSDSYPEPHDVLDNMFYEFQETPFLAWSESWDKPVDKSTSGSMGETPKDMMDHFARKVDHFHQLLGVYTTKQLTMASDSINGFTGAMKVFSRHDPNFKVISGLPAFGVGTATHITAKNLEALLAFRETCFIRELCWVHQAVYKNIRGTTEEGAREEEIVGRDRRDCLPSWSWAGWSGQASWSYTWGMNDLRESLLTFNLESTEWEDGIIADWLDLVLLAQGRDHPKFLLGEACVLSKSDGRDVASWEDSKATGSTDSSFHTVESVQAHLSVDTKSHDIIQKVESGRWSYMVMAVHPGKESTYHSMMLMLVAWDDADDVGQERKTCHRLGMVSATVNFDIKALPQAQFRLG